MKPLQSWALTILYVGLSILIAVIGHVYNSPSLAASLIWIALLYLICSALADLGQFGSYPFGDGEAWAGFQFIKGGFRIATRLYFGGITVSGIRSQLPKAGEATLLYFNHANGLTDSMLTVRTCPRMVRFVAKDTLWKLPLIGSLIRTAAAVPISRREDHDGTTDNRPSFREISTALEHGQCIGIAPSGNSKMRTMVDEMKPGIGLMAIETVFNHLHEDFTVKLVPCGLTYLHRCRWQSEAIVIYGKPIEVTSKFLRERGVTEDMTSWRSPRRARCVEDIMKLVQAGMDKVVMSVPPPDTGATPVQVIEGDFVALQRGVTAAQLYCDGQFVSILKWMGCVRHFASLLQDGGPHADLGERISQYQRTLDGLCIPDSFVEIGNNRGRWFRILVLSIYILVLGIVAMTGVILFIPFWILSFWHSNRVVGKGLVKYGCLSKHGRELLTQQIEAIGKHSLNDDTIVRHRANFDTIAERNMSFGLVWLLTMLPGSSAVVAHSLEGIVTHSWQGVVIGVLCGWLVIPGILWLMVRSIDAAAAYSRQHRAWRGLRCMTDQSLSTLCSARSSLKDCVYRLPGQPAALGYEDDVTDRLPWWDHFGLTGRTKASWQEHFGLRQDTTYMSQHEALPTSTITLSNDALAAPLCS